LGTTLRAAGTEQQQEEGAKTDYETKFVFFVVFLLLTPMSDCVVKVIELCAGLNRAV
jgi:hypothetical protein